MTTSVMLPDSTVVHLNAESSLRYPTFFAGEARRVELTGEAYFNVSRHPEKRFIVSTPCRSSIEVYGTRFNVEAYEEQDRISTTLVEGSVGFCYQDHEGNARKITLTPHHKLVYQRRRETPGSMPPPANWKRHGRTAKSSSTTRPWTRYSASWENGIM